MSPTKNNSKENKRKQRVKANRTNHSQLKRNNLDATREGSTYCWCQGTNIGCGRILAPSTRRKHFAKEKHKNAAAMDVDQDCRSSHFDNRDPVALRSIQESPSDEMEQDENVAGGNIKNRWEKGSFQSKVVMSGESAATTDGELMEEVEDMVEDMTEVVFDQNEAGEEDPTDAIIRQAEEERRLEREKLIVEHERQGLCDDDLQQMQVLAHSIKHRLPRKALKDLALIWRGAPLKSPFRMQQILNELSGLEEEAHHCCINTCILFYGTYANYQHCPECKEPRLDNRGHPRNVFRYLPITSRLQALFKSEKTIKQLDYRSHLGAFNDVYRDVFDGEHFRSLLDTPVEIEKVIYDHKIGEDPHDIFLGIAFDGISLFRGHTAQPSDSSITCWPISIIVYSFSPSIRTQLAHMFSLGIIPGPHQPKVTNSFLEPFYDELKQGAIGVQTYHSLRKQMFPMRFYLLHGQADILGKNKLQGGKGPGAFHPCFECPITSIRDESIPRSKYYLPHHRPNDTKSRTDRLLTRLKPHAHHVQVWDQMISAKTREKAKKIGDEYGINSVPILGLLPSVDIVKSFPQGIMHQIYLNTVGHMIDHWKGTFKNLDSSDDKYRIESVVWEKIGKESKNLTQTTPSWMVRSMPDIWQTPEWYNAESFAFWITWVAPYVLKDRLPREHYDHLLLFIKIIKMTTSLEISKDDLTMLESNVKEWHAQYERLYYRYEYKRLSACPLTIHTLIHIPNNTRGAGPLARLWEFVTERMMGFIARSVTNKQHPFAQASNRLMHIEQMKLLALKYGVEDKLNFSRKRRDWNETRGGEEMILGISNTAVLKGPREIYAWSDDDRLRCAVYFKDALRLEADKQTISKALPTHITRCARLRFRGEKEIIRSKYGMKQLSRDTARDSSFVKFQLRDDENFYYGQLLYITHVVLPKKPSIGVDRKQQALIGMIRVCNSTGKDASLEPVWYEKMGTTRAVNVEEIKCGIGRVKCEDRWGILDTSCKSAKPAFADFVEEPDEAEDDDDDDDSDL